MKKKTIIKVLVWFLVIFSLIFIVTGIMVKNESFVIKNSSRSDVLVTFRLKKWSKDSSYLLKSGNKLKIAGNKTLQRRTPATVKEEFLKRTIKLNIYSQKDSINLNLLKKNEKYLIDKGNDEIKIIYEFN